jgi:hypothetical protein
MFWVILYVFALIASTYMHGENARVQTDDSGSLQIK